MKKTLFALLVVVLLAATMLASSPAVSLKAVAATGAGDSYSFPDGTKAITWQTTFSGTPTAITVNLEGSIDDGATWATLDTSTSTSGEMRHVVNKHVKLLRCNIAAYTVNSSTATCQFSVSSK